MDTLTASQLPAELAQMVQLIQTSSRDILPCGAAVYHLLTSLSSRFHPHRKGEIEQVTATLTRLADERILSYHYKDVPTCWRRLYTDARLLAAISSIASCIGDVGLEEESRLCTTIRQLDMVIIVAGAPGEGRYEMALELIKRAQKKCPTILEDTQLKEPLAKRQKLSADRAEEVKARQSIPAPAVQHPIPRLDDFPSFGSYLKRYHKEPFIVSEGCVDWPAYELWSELGYLQDKAGVGRCVPVEVGADYTAREWCQEILPFDQVSRSVFGLPKIRPKNPTSPENGEVVWEDEPVHYLAQHDIFRQIPELRNDILIPDLVFSSPPEHSPDFAEYAAPKNDDGYVLNAWLGPKAAFSPAHTDPYYNCYAQIVGSKWIWVAPPSCSSAMSAFGLSSSAPTTSTDNLNLNDEPASGGEHEDEDEQKTNHSHLLTNTSRVDVSSPDTYDQAFKEQVVPFAKQAVLRTGDVLFLPPGWWHSLKGLEPSFSVSIWF
ncbi:BQ2448_7087 [Microbotryum intermedium]|uniref:BQ2448_7087 protein n=1 Tax=Microbotryum intermedium TaxID=269621 RepID=A0A238FH73_9BASI|nr:BQ2448_7087 [Microbotryum intermedium]